MLGYLDDIASDLSAFHRITDAGEMEAAVFFRMVFRLPAYTGVLAARLAAEAEDQPETRRPQGGRMTVTYDRGSEQANNAAMPRSDQPATAAQLTALNAQLGGQFFSHAAVT